MRSSWKTIVILFVVVVIINITIEYERVLHNPLFRFFVLCLVVYVLWDRILYKYNIMFSDNYIGHGGVRLKGNSIKKLWKIGLVLKKKQYFDSYVEILNEIIVQDKGGKYSNKAKKEIDRINRQIKISG